MSTSTSTSTSTSSTTAPVPVPVPVPVPHPLPLPSLGTSSPLIKATFHPSSYGSINRSDRADSIDMDVHEVKHQSETTTDTDTTNNTAPVTSTETSNPNPNPSTVDKSPSRPSSPLIYSDPPHVILSTTSLHNAIIILLLLVSAGIILYYLARGDVRIILATVSLMCIACCGLRGVFRHDIQCLRIYWMGLLIWTLLFILVVIIFLARVGVLHYAETRCGFPSFVATYGPSIGAYCPGPPPGVIGSSTVSYHGPSDAYRAWCHSDTCCKACLREVEQALIIEAIGFSTVIAIVMFLIVHQGYRLYSIVSSFDEFAARHPSISAPPPHDFHTRYVVVAGTLAAPVVRPCSPHTQFEHDRDQYLADESKVSRITPERTVVEETAAKIRHDDKHSFGSGVVGARDTASASRTRPATAALSETGVRRRHVPTATPSAAVTSSSTSISASATSSASTSSSS